MQCELEYQDHHWVHHKLLMMHFISAACYASLTSNAGDHAGYAGI